jgi:hypothetical protein
VAITPASGVETWMRTDHGDNAAGGEQSRRYCRGHDGEPGASRG